MKLIAIVRNDNAWHGFGIDVEYSESSDPQSFVDEVHQKYSFPKKPPIIEFYEVKKINVTPKEVVLKWFVEDCEVEDCEDE